MYKKLNKTFYEDNIVSILIFIILGHFIPFQSLKIYDVFNCVKHFETDKILLFLMFDDYLRVLKADGV